MIDARGLFLSLGPLRRRRAETHHAGAYHPRDGRTVPEAVPLGGTLSRFCCYCCILTGAADGSTGGAIHRGKAQPYALVRPEARRLRVEGDARGRRGALALLEGHPVTETVYRQWRELGASVTASLIRAGEAAKERDEVRPDG